MRGGGQAILENREDIRMIGKKVGKLITVLSAIAISFSTVVGTNTLEVRAAQTWDYSYTGGEQQFTAPSTGKYRFVLYGASGGINQTMASGDNGRAKAMQASQGGVTAVEIALMAGETLYLNVGGEGTTSGAGGYNGGGNSSNGAGSGGGATSVSKTSGLLANTLNQTGSVIAVAGGGGGSREIPVFNSCCGATFRPKAVSNFS